MFKKIITIGVILGLMSAVYGCTRKNNNSHKDKTQETRAVIQPTKSYKFIRESISGTSHAFRLSFRILPITDDEEAINGEMGVSGNNMYVETTTQELGKSKIIIKDNTLYTIVYDSKTVFSSDISENSNINPIAFITEEKDINFSAENAYYGTGELEGKTYEFEEFKAQDKVMRLYFDGASCKGIVLTEEGVSQTVVIEEYEATLDNSLLDIPSDYKLIAWNNFVDTTYKE